MGGEFAMAKENDKKETTMSLADLGLEDEVTPAEAAKKNEEHKLITDGGTEITVKKVDIKEEVEDKPKKSRRVPRPKQGKPVEDDDDEKRYNVITDINKIAKNPVTSSKNQITGPQKMLNDLNALADKGIEREKNELMAPGGRIDEAKQKYVEDRYASLMKRSKVSKQLANKIKFYEDAMETDPTFDGISDYERKGYILYKVANDDSIGITDKSFGLAQESIRKNRMSSAEATKTVDNMTDNQTDEGSEDQFVLGTGSEDAVMRVATSEEISKEKEEASVLSNPEETVYDEINKDMETIEEDTTPNVEVTSSEIMNDMLDPGLSMTDEIMDDINEEIKEDTDPFVEAYGMTSDAYDKMRVDYLKDAAKLLNIEEEEDLNDLQQSTAVNLNTALKMFMQQKKEKTPQPLHITWPLMHTGVPVITTAFSGQELTQFIDDIQEGFVGSEDNPNPEPTIEQLMSIFRALYSHNVGRGRPSFYAWLKSISSADFNNLIFSQYVAQFESNNYLSYQCPKKGCSRLFLEKKNIMDMISFPNDKTKERFEKIKRGESVLSGLYKTPPVPINEYFAISFAVPSIYSMNFEPASLTKEFKKKYSSVVGFLPMIDSVHVIDRRNNTTHKIDFGAIKDDIEKTTIRKVQGIMKIMVQFNIDQRSKIYGEYLKVLKNMNQDDVSYYIPATKCPICKSDIPQYATDPIGALFMRARLSIEAASTPALL